MHGNDALRNSRWQQITFSRLRINRRASCRNRCGLMWPRRKFVRDPVYTKLLRRDCRNFSTVWMNTASFPCAISERREPLPCSSIPLQFSKHEQNSHIPIFNQEAYRSLFTRGPGDDVKVVACRGGRRKQPSPSAPSWQSRTEEPHMRQRSRSIAVVVAEWFLGFVYCHLHHLGEEHGGVAARR